VIEDDETTLPSDEWYPYGGDIRGNTKLPCPYCGIDIRTELRQQAGEP